MTRTVRLATLLLLLGCSSDPAPAQDAARISDASGDVLGDVAGDAGAGADAGPELPCNPLAAEGDCALPFPSDHFLVADPSMPSGRRVALPTAAMPRDRRGNPVNLHRDHPADGFSHGAQILARLPQPIDPAPLATYDPANPQRGFDRSLAVESPTALLEADTGRRVPHIAEVDPRPEASRAALVIRPLERLRNRARYVVAIRGLRTREGAVIPPTEGFRAVRDRVGSSALAARYEADVFPVLQRAQIDRASLQLAWDFTTESQELVTRDLRAVRDDAIARLRATPPTVRVERVIDNPGPHVAKRIEVQLRVPMYTEDDVPGTELARDATGRPAFQRWIEVPATVIVPPSVLRAGASPARFLQFGHGFFGTREEVAGGFVPTFADAHGFVAACLDWSGMSTEDLAFVLRAIATDPSATIDFTDRVPQAMVNQLSLAAARGSIAALPQLQRDGASVLDASAAYFVGISQGHILGGTYLALSHEVRRAALEVGGANFSFMMFRARPFAGFLTVIGMSVPDRAEQQLFASISQTTFDRIDPLTWAPYVVREPLPESPRDRVVLLQMGLGDTQVPNAATELHARALGIPTLSPSSARPVPGLDAVTAPTDRSALTVFDLGLRELPGAQGIPPNDGNIVHEGVRMLRASMRQLDALLRPDGRITHPCDGPCDPE